MSLIQTQPRVSFLSLCCNLRGITRSSRLLSNMNICTRSHRQDVDSISVSLLLSLSRPPLCPQQKVHHKKTEAKNKNEDENMHRSKCTHVNDQTQKKKRDTCYLNHRPLSISGFTHGCRRRLLLRKFRKIHC